jgi:hypothetical protein
MVPAGRRLSWSYAEQGPLVPLPAYFSDRVAPGWVVVLRLPVVVLTVATVVMRVSWVNYGIRVSLCSGPIRPWSQIWPELMTLRIDYGA